MKKITAILCTLFTLSTFTHSLIAHSSDIISSQDVTHSLGKISKEGTLIAIEDESQWIIPESDSYISSKWHLGDVLVITPNSSYFAYFSNYTYTLSNLSTGTSTVANLYYGPRINGALTKQVTETNFTDGDVTLSDGSSWRVSTHSEKDFSNWQVSDYVIVGTSNYANKNILINVNLNQYIESINFN